MTRWLVRGGLIATCDEHHSTFEGDVAIDEGAIVALGPEASSALPLPYRALDARGCAVLPGFVRGHTHLAQTLFRGGGAPPGEWLRRHAQALEAAHDDESLTASAELGLVELARSGTTTLLDAGAVNGQDALFEAYLQSGLRVLGGKTMADTARGVPKRSRETTASSLRESERLADAWHGREGRVSYAYGPRSLRTCSERLLRSVAEAAKARRAHVHMHAEGHGALGAARGSSEVGALARLGLAGPHVVFAHGARLGERELARLARTGTRAVHCPGPESGPSPLRELLSRGVLVGLGPGGALGEGDLDVFRAMRSAGPPDAGRAAALDARAALHLATLAGARALGLEGWLGSLEVGKRADLAVVALGDLHTAPALDPLAAIASACQSRDVRHVMVGGRLLVRNGEPLFFDAPRVAARAREEARRVGRLAAVL